MRQEKGYAALSNVMVVPFGKYAGMAVRDLVAKDPTYVNWLMNQSRTAKQFPELHAALRARAPADSDSPEHNAIQVKFLDKNYRLACFVAALERQGLRAEDVKKDLGDLVTDNNAYFEVGNVDVSVHWIGTHEKRNFGALLHNRDLADHWGSSPYTEDYNTNIEIKPSMGDDFPSVIRQVRRLGCRLLVVDRYEGQTPARDVAAMFATARCTIVQPKHIEKCL